MEQRYNYLASTLEERNTGFINALCEDITKLQSCGFMGEQVKKMLGTLSYIKIWCNQPQWLVPVKNLPKGYKWSDGVWFHKSGGKRSESETYYFLEVGEDLYIKGWGIAGEKCNQHTNVRIPNWKDVPFRKIDEFLHCGFLRDCFLQYWHGHQLDIGFVEHTLRECDRFG